MPKRQRAAWPDKRAVPAGNGKIRAYRDRRRRLGRKILKMRRVLRGFGAAPRLAAGVSFALGTGLIASANGSTAAPGVLELRCTNPTGGATWSIVVDLERGLVDSRPATITNALIKWRDPKGGVYELDRSNWKLQLRGASSTGGYFLHYTCQPE
jgi:hypothetical protein